MDLCKPEVCGLHLMHDFEPLLPCHTGAPRQPVRRFIAMRYSCRVSFQPSPLGEPTVEVAEFQGRLRP